MTREIKFRAWDKNKKIFLPEDSFAVLTNHYSGALFVMIKDFENYKEGEYGYDYDFILVQYTGLKDKNGVAEVYEGDIIDEYGNIKGNIYQMDKGETDTVIQGFGTKTWCETYSRAILLGLKNAE